MVSRSTSFWVVACAIRAIICIYNIQTAVPSIIATFNVVSFIVTKAILNHCKHKRLDFEVLNNEGYRYLDACILKNDIELVKIFTKHIKPSLEHLNFAISNEKVAVAKELLNKLNVPKSVQLHVTFARFSQNPSDSKCKESLQNLLNGTEDNDVKILYYCTQCYISMLEANCKIFACKSDHYMCQDCKEKPIQSCIHCKEDFDTDNLPKRRLTAERLRVQLKNQDCS